ncbi:MAG: hypothetical protein CM1200mP9_01890 [Gammaproteobacteria bacterium]|nr:MAG: hypothetical protein CM1200mP9_01890 [Gammaproteobacteria bacterium]
MLLLAVFDAQERWPRFYDAFGTTRETLENCVSTLRSGENVNEADAEEVRGACKDSRLI